MTCFSLSARSIISLFLSPFCFWISGRGPIYILAVRGENGGIVADETRWTRRALRVAHKQFRGMHEQRIAQTRKRGNARRRDRRRLLPAQKRAVFSRRTQTRTRPRRGENCFVLVDGNAVLFNRVRINNWQQAHVDFRTAARAQLRMRDASSRTWLPAQLRSIKSLFAIGRNVASQRRVRVSL